MLNTGVSVPLLMVRAESLPFVDGLITFTVYACLVTPSWAVTMVVIVLVPTANVIAPEALPDATAVPFTVTVAVASATVGVTVTEAVPLVTISL